MEERNPVGDLFNAFWEPLTPLQRAVFRNGIPDSANTYNTPNNSTQYDATHAFYFEDRWRPLTRLRTSDAT